MLLHFSNGDLFATGATIYNYNPVPGSDVSARVILQAKIEGQVTSVIIDTAAPYLVCSPQLASEIGFAPDVSAPQVEMYIRGIKVRGKLHRVSLTLLADYGDDLSWDVTAFVPSSDESFIFPTFLVFMSCLEWIRIAVDPLSNTFFFGPYS